MAKIAGRLSRALISSNGGTTYVYVNGIVDVAFNYNQGEIDVTAHDDGDARTYITGRKDGTLDLKMRYDEGDPGQVQLQASIVAGSVVLFKFRMIETTGLREWRASGFPTKCTISGPNDAEAGYDVTVRLTGPVTQTVQ